MKALPRVMGCLIGLLACNCSDDAGPGQQSGGKGGSGATGTGGFSGTGSGGSGNAGVGGSGNAGAGGSGAGGAGGSGDAGAGGSGNAGAGGSGNAGAGGSGNAGAGGSGAAGAGGNAGASGTTGSGGAGGGGPNVDIPGVACGGVLDANVMTPFATIGGRQVFIDYPCRKPQRTPVTFILNLHGTFQLENGKHYIRGYFPTYKFMDTNNFIIATPKSVVSQWGNNDG